MLNMKAPVVPDFQEFADWIGLIRVEDALNENTGQMMSYFVSPTLLAIDPRKEPDPC